MKKVLTVVLAVVLMCGVVMAQDMPAGSQTGAKSLNFTFGGLGTFGLNNAGLSASYFLSNEAAIRGGLNISSFSQSQKPPSTVTNGKTAEMSQFTVSLAADYLMYQSGGRVKPYMGAGVNFGMTSGSEKNTSAAEIKTGGISFGLGAIVGAEFYLYNEISLSAEYNLNLITISSPSDTETTNGGTTVKSPGISTTSILGFGAAGATLHIYF